MPLLVKELEIQNELKNGVPFTVQPRKREKRPIREIYE